MPANKKNSKKNSNQEKEMEKQVEKIEKTVKKIKAENERTVEINKKAEIIREDLNNQLMQQNKFGKHFEDMVEDYIFFFKMKEDMRQDLVDNGLRYRNTGGNGFTTFKPNESVLNILKVNGQMLKILQDLELKAPDEEGEGDDLLS